MALVSGPWSKPSRVVGIAAALTCAVLLYGNAITRSYLTWVGRPAFASGRSWCYQLSGADAERLARQPCDILVAYPIDASQRPIGPRELERLRWSSDGTRRTVLAYLSVGEAEAHRDYWKAEWLDDRPWWLVGRNPAWRGAYRVRYWAKEWQDGLFRSPQSRLAQILGAGFDGVFLDNVDVFGAINDSSVDLQQEMVRLVIDLAAAARALRPDALIVPQNGEELLAHPRYLLTIDGIAKEDLLFGIPGDGVRNASADIEHSLALLQAVRAQAKPVLVVEYISDAATIERARKELSAHGFVPAFTTRLLDRDPAAALREQDGFTSAPRRSN